MSSQGSCEDQESWSHRTKTQHGDDAVGGSRPCQLRVSCGRWQEAQTTHQKEALRLEWGQS